MPQDSTGRPISVGDKVRFRGQVYTIKSFGKRNEMCDVHTIFFEETQHTAEVANETSVDRVEEVEE